MYRTISIAAVTAVGALVSAAPSLADTISPTPLSFDNLVLQTQPTGNLAIVSPSTQPVTATAQLDTTTGAFTIDPSTFSAPTYSYSTPVMGSATLTLASPASGTINFATGAVTLNGDFIATLNIPSAGGSCAVNTGPLTLSTATTLPLPGTSFPAGATGLATGNGAFGAGWTSLPPGTGPACDTIDPFIDSGNGGIWISRGISPSAAGTVTPPSTPTPVTPPTTPTPATPAKIAVTAATPKAVAAGKSANVKVTVANTGGAATSSVKVCLVAKKPLSASKCQTVSNPGAALKRTLTFKVTTTKTTKVGKHLLTLTATGQKNKTVTLKVTKA